MSINLGLPEGVETEESDVLGGGANLVDSAPYHGTIEMAYLHTNDNGTVFIHIDFKPTSGGKTISQNIYISNRKGEFTYTDKDDNKQPLPGYSLMNSFFKTVTGKPIDQQETKVELVGIYDYNAKEEVDTEVNVFTDTIDKPVVIGILHVREEKTTAESGYKDGTGEYREYNEFSKFFDAADGRTITEKSTGVKDPLFLAKWKTKNNGQVIVKPAKNPGAAAKATAGNGGGTGSAAADDDNPFA